MPSSRYEIMSNPLQDQALKGAELLQYEDYGALNFLMDYSKDDNNLLDIKPYSDRLDFLDFEPLDKLNELKIKEEFAFGVPDFSLDAFKAEVQDSKAPAILGSSSGWQFSKVKIEDS